MATQLKSVEIDDPLDGVSLPGWVYHDPDFFAIEMEGVIRPSWQIVCHVSEIPAPGDWRSLELLGENIVVIRGDDGAVRGFHNVCRHRASRLLDGEGGCAARLTCPYHGWSYARDGRLTGVPGRSDYPGLAMARLGLKPVGLEVWKGFVFVSLNPPRSRGGGAREASDGGGAGPDAILQAASPLHHSMVPLPVNGEDFSVSAMMAPFEALLAPYRLEDLRAIGRVTSRPRALNWKTIADNYSDALHIPVAHPGLTRLFGRGYGIAAGDHVDHMWGDLVERPSANVSERAYQRLLPRADHLPEERQRHWCYLKLWPNIAFDIYPDQIDFMQFIPVSATETIIREIAYALPDAFVSEERRREMRAARYLNWRINRQVNAEDTVLISRVQAGMASRSYEPGPLGESEVALRSFARKLRAIIPEAREPNKPLPFRGGGRGGAALELGAVGIPTPTQFGVNDPPDRSGSAWGRTDPELLKGRG